MSSATVCELLHTALIGETGYQSKLPEMIRTAMNWPNSVPSMEIVASDFCCTYIHYIVNMQHCSFPCAFTHTGSDEWNHSRAGEVVVVFVHSKHTLDYRNVAL